MSTRTRNVIVAVLLVIGIVSTITLVMGCDNQHATKPCPAGCDIPRADGSVSPRPGWGAD